jgi:hypothetical protein
VDVVPAVPPPAVPVGSAVLPAPNGPPEPPINVGSMLDFWSLEQAINPTVSMTKPLRARVIWPPTITARFEN